MLPVLPVLSVLTVLPVLLGVVGGIWGLGYNLRVCCLNEAYFDTALLDIQIVASSLMQIQAGLSASADEIIWVQSAYLIAEVVIFM